MGQAEVVFGGSGGDHPSILMWADTPAEAPPVVLSDFAFGYSVYGMVVSPNGTRLAAGTKAGLLRVHGLTGSRGTANAAVLFDVFHPPAITSLAFCTEDLLASGGMDGKIKVWSIAQGGPVAQVAAHPGGVLALAAIESLGLASIGMDGFLRLWDLDTLKVAFESGPFAMPRIQALATVVYNPAMKLVMHPSGDGRVHIYDATNGWARRFVPAHHGDFAAMACGPRGVATGGLDDSTLKVWSPSMEQVISQTPVAAGIASVTWVGADHVMTVLEDGRALIWAFDGRLTTVRQIEGLNLRVCTGLPPEFIAGCKAEEEQRWRDERLGQARTLLNSTLPRDQIELAGIVQDLRNRGFVAEAHLVLADAARAQDRPLCELQSRLASIDALGDGQAAVPALYALAELLERIQEPELARLSYGKVVAIESGYRDAGWRVAKLQGHPLAALSPEDGVRGDFTNPDQIAPELEKYTILGRKFQWRVVVGSKPFSVPRIQVPLEDAADSVMTWLRKHDTPIVKVRTERVRLLLDGQVSLMEWVYVFATDSDTPGGYALQVRPSVQWTELTGWEIFDPRMLDVPDSASPQEHNLKVQDAWVRTSSSAQIKRWFADIHRLATGVIGQLANRIAAEQENEF